MKIWYSKSEKEVRGDLMFSFLREILNKHHVNVVLIDQKSPSQKATDEMFDNALLFEQIASTLRERVLYTFTDSFFRCYYFLRLPQTEKANVLCIGPYLKSELSPQSILEISEEKDLPPQQHKYLAEYYRSLPVLLDNSPLITMLNVFCERIWESPSFTVKDLTDKYAASDAPFTKTLSEETSDSPINKTAIERRYAFENELIRAVSLGQPHMENQFRSAFSNDFFEKRATTPLRNAKNYAIIMNTLLRKGAEKGGVHPLYLDSLSSEFAHKIENLSSLTENDALMSEMFRAYCRLVRKHTLRKYSLTVQKTILKIEADISVQLAPKKLAQQQGVTLGYLSTVFKKETGKTLSEYIRERRMEYAEYLLRTSNLQVQTIALHCGIMDAQYFSKLFKKQYGKTPLDYRRTP